MSSTNTQNSVEQIDSEQSSSTACIICGQEHDLSYLKTKPVVTGHSRNRVRPVTIILPILLFVVLAQILSSSYSGRMRCSSETAALNNLRTIEQAEESFRQDHGRYGSFEDLIAADELTSKWDMPIRSGYYFSIKIASDAIVISARPINYDTDHRTSFISYIESDGKNARTAIYGADKGGAEASRFDELIGKSPGK